MKLSLVLWNCDGIEGTEGQLKANVEKRKNVLRSTYDSWKQENQIPTVVLAQELHLVRLTTTWRELSKKSNSFGTCEAACFFLKSPGLEIKFLDSGDLQSIMNDKLESDDRYHDGIARIHCSIVTIGAEKILICSWHGQHYKLCDDVKETLLRKMLIFVDKVREDQGCVAALVGGDFNLAINKVFESTILQSVQSADLYGNNTSDMIDYVIAWPKNRFILREWGGIETYPVEGVNPNPRVFDHDLISYDFTVILKGEWEGEGEVKWGGKCGEGKVTLTGDHDVEVTGVKSKKCMDLCESFKKLDIEGSDLLSVNYGEMRIDVAEDERVTLMSNGYIEMVKWGGTGMEVHRKALGFSKDEQTVTWNGTGLVVWKGKGKATWVGGKLVKWEGSQTVRCADDRSVEWDGDGKVELKGGEFKCSHQGTWAKEEPGDEGVRYSLTKRSKLGWSGRGVVWKVTGTGAGTMLDWKIE